MSGITEADGDLLRTAKAKFSVIQGDIETAAQHLAGVQHEFPSAIKGEIGNATVNALGNVYEHLKGATNMIQERIMNPLDGAGIKADMTALSEAERIRAANPDDGTINVGHATGDWNNNQFEDASALGQDMSKVNLNF
ncbi:hypothetical protein AB0346_14515 [Nocardia beijingensis]|uniref:hypothetical protein n=1 Tax=Nocardia beijingensis TaxID=95162 RepID=UPI00344D4F24